MSLNEPITPEAIEDAGIKVGLDASRLKTDMSSKEEEEVLMQNRRLASALGLQ